MPSFATATSGDWKEPLTVTPVGRAARQMIPLKAAERRRLRIACGVRTTLMPTHLVRHVRVTGCGAVVEAIARSLKNQHVPRGEPRSSRATSANGQRPTATARTSSDPATGCRKETPWGVTCRKNCRCAAASDHCGGRSPRDRLAGMVVQPRDQQLARVSRSSISGRVRAAFARRSLEEPRDKRHRTGRWWRFDVFVISAPGCSAAACGRGLRQNGHSKS
jgi:hypothetical protein